MTACKQNESMGAAASDSKSAAKSDGAEDRKPSRKGKKGKGKLAVLFRLRIEKKRRLAVKSKGTEKPKTYDLSDVTRGLAVMCIAGEKSEDETLALLHYQDEFWMENFKGVYDRPSVDAIRQIAAEKWKLFNDSDKAPYVAMARTNKIILAKFDELEKTLKLTRAMTTKMMNLKM